MRAAIFQSDTAGQSPTSRLERLRHAASEAEADLLLCPELFMSGYATPDDIKRFAEPFDGPFASGVASIAKATSTAIAYGYPEVADGKLFNSAQCVDAQGQTVSRQRKLMLPPGFEADIFASGGGLTNFQMHGLTMAFLICYDVEFPEAVRAAAVAGAQVILVPTALGNQWGVVATRVVPSRAFENGAYVMYANHAGAENEMTYLGESCIVGPDGVDLARAATGEAIISAELSADRVAAAQHRLPYHQDLQALRSQLQVTSDLGSSSS